MAPSCGLNSADPDRKARRLKLQAEWHNGHGGEVPAGDSGVVKGGVVQDPSGHLKPHTAPIRVWGWGVSFSCVHT